MNLLAELLKAAVRIEKKLDEVMKMTMKSARSSTPGDLPPMVQPLGTSGQGCPLCQRAVTYRPVNLPQLGQVVLRSCGCAPVPTELPQQGEADE